MKYGNNIRRAALAVAAVSAALTVTACQADDDAAGGAPSQTSSATASAASGAPASKPSPAGASSAPGKGTSGGTGTGTGTGSGSGSGGSSGSTAKTCPVTALNVVAYQAANRPPGTGTGAAIVEFTNASGQACVVQGHPTVAAAGNGSPQHNKPLSVTPKGSASPVRLAPGGKAYAKLTFVQVQGEADGYCKSGAQPSVYPTMVIGLPGSGAHQVALQDGQLAECDDTVTVTAVSAAKPS
ncbi:DUF4232 domain-containing protein [Streptomyces olivochromogenes]|uniref:DUF4232 domain-containing protein n=1 Tax=Streptomyces olivochromogenes TaxID=1963 RepID=UPI001F452350|nr:DUF4232 domain-containing protein [Streptomyces olivochromogenes]MCF3130701.1 DUF4232 domain-containing protein [Streptomyces olivochromogenes]